MFVSLPLISTWFLCCDFNCMESNFVVMNILPGQPISSLTLRVLSGAFMIDSLTTPILPGLSTLPFNKHNLPGPPHCAKKPVTTMLTYPWKCTVLHCNHPGNTWKPLVLMTRHFDYCPSASEGDNQSVKSSAPVVSRCFLGGYNVKLYISRGRLAWWLLAFLHSAYV